ncbi:tetratricopeptide repeat protein [Marinifilum caeruleilacunae]|uniref:Tetratricopeptide repeat protein n=1 Tax=Marinifilum caeruleilacunae TaxID=2499076 RepID=A0ABX1WQW7_9BACT|nr:tetratricopeptide repeat protein [Marinifilum caeruleilacunae]NOU58483.1 tetratricopeptide repeat protein [Marinifilum caeruleilacunae]
MKKSISVIIVSIFALSLHAQDKLSIFSKYIQEGDTLKQKEHLETWSKEEPRNAELQTAYFNYYFNKSRNEIITLNSGNPPKDQKVLVLTDSTDQIAGFIGSQINYDKSNLKKAFESIDKGIQLYPNRLDMRFGKIFALGQIKDWRSFTDEIIKAINHSAINKNNWTWTYNEKQEGGKEMFLGSLQDYQGQLYNTMNDKLLVNMQEISQAVLVHYPNHIESLSNLSIAYLVSKKYDKALVPLLKAEQINPTDFIVLNNIAYAYKESGKSKEAISYYKKVIKYGDQRAKAQAEKEIQHLQE